VARRIPGGIRSRTTLIATVAVGVALAVGAIVLLAVLDNNLADNLRTSIETQAEDRSRLLDSGAEPTTLVATRQDETIVWIGTPDGETLASGGSYEFAEPPTNLEPGPARNTTVLLLEGESEQERSEITVAVAEAADGTLLVVGTELEDVARTTDEVRNLLLVGFPFLLAGVALVTWSATGRILRPVEEIRSTAEDIGSGPIDERVPVPASKDEIGRLAVTVNAMLDRLEDERQAQRRFTADASHELKSPVANLRTLVETTELQDPQWQETQTRLVSESDRLAAIVDELLFLAVADEGGASRAADRIHLDDVIFDEARLLAETSGVKVDIAEVSPCDVIGSVDALRRAVRNLANNAARHARTEVRFATVTGSPEGTVLIQVADDGPGVAPDERDRVFERFSRLDQARDRTSGGTGLGLAIVRSIADAHGGSVSVGEAPGGGALFTVTLPAAPDLG
jgi:signal transduction histidine kinase